MVYPSSTTLIPTDRWTHADLRLDTQKGKKGEMGGGNRGGERGREEREERERDYKSSTTRIPTDRWTHADLRLDRQRVEVERGWEGGREDWGRREGEGRNRIIHIDSSDE